MTGIHTMSSFAGARPGDRPPTAPVGYRYLGDAEETPLPKVRAAVVVPLYGAAAWCAQRRKAPGMGRLEFPGGRPEPGELMRDAALRELREEMGVAVPASRLRLFGVFTYPTPAGATEVAVYTLRLRGDEAPQDTEPLQRGRWELLTLRELALRAAKRALMPSGAAAVAALCCMETPP